MSRTVLSIPVFSLRRIETPFERKPGYKDYVAIVNARDLPDLSDWREINVRDPKARGRVPHKIRESFREGPEEFVFKNRGLVIAAEKVEFVEAGSVVKLTMTDPQLHGLLDGGHTYRIVREEASTLSEDDAPRYVRLEIITGFDQDEIYRLVDARNTSNQVRDESLANLHRDYEDIKAVLKGHLYYDEIAWSEYEELAGEPKPIDVRDIISFLITFDTKHFNSTVQPLIAYKDKRACLKYFKEHSKNMKRLYPLLPEILLLWDEIHVKWREWYNAGRQEEEGKTGKFGKLTGVKMDAPEDLYFKRVKASYGMPEAYKYPILSALRAAVTVNGSTARWSANPFEIAERTGSQLTTIVGQTIRATNNPNKTGKDLGTWSSCYLVVESTLKGSISKLQEQKIAELEKELEELNKGGRRK